MAWHRVRLSWTSTFGYRDADEANCGRDGMSVTSSRRVADDLDRIVANPRNRAVEQSFHLDDERRRPLRHLRGQERTRPDGAVVGPVKQRNYPLDRVTRVEVRQQPHRCGGCLVVGRGLGFDPVEEFGTVLEGIRDRFGHDPDSFF